MKRLLCLLLIVVLFLTSCSMSSPQNPSSKVTPKLAENKKDTSVTTAANTKSYTKAVGLTDNCGFNIGFLKDIGFDTIILRVNGIRSYEAPYKTNFAELKKLKETTAIFDAQHIKYIIEITSGPGFSPDGTVNTIYSKEIERIYFAQMVKELVKRYNGNQNFKGISIKLDNPDIPASDYYKTEDYIISKVRESYPEITALYNLHPLTFEMNLSNMPIMNNDKNILNLTIYFKGIVYPGYGAGYKSSIKLDKNDMLKRFQALKEFENKNKQHIMITIQTPWADKSDVFLQDTFEIFKMIGFDYTLFYGNSFDIFDFSKNDAVVKVLKRHSK